MSKLQRYKLLQEEVQDWLDRKEPDLIKVIKLVQRIQPSKELAFAFYEQVADLRHEEFRSIDNSSLENVLGYLRTYIQQEMAGK